MKFVRMIQEGSALWKREERWRRQRVPLMTLELAEYTRDECLLAAAHCEHIEPEQVGVVGLLLWHRAARGKVTLEQALSRYELKETT